MPKKAKPKPVAKKEKIFYRVVLIYERLKDIFIEADWYYVDNSGEFAISHFFKDDELIASIKDWDMVLKSTECCVEKGPSVFDPLEA